MWISRSALMLAAAMLTAAEDPVVPPVQSPTSAPTDLPRLSIQEIQGTGYSSPWRGRMVMTRLVAVTAVVYNGFFVQEVASSTDASAGLFVYTGFPAPRLDSGVQLFVEGEVQEFFGQTQITSESFSSTSVEPRIFPPVPLEFPFSEAVDMEKLEGMLVTIVPAPGKTLVVSEYYNLDRYGEIVICAADSDDGRWYQFSQMNAPDVAAYEAHLDLKDRSCITIDDNDGRQNPPTIAVGGLYPVSTNETPIRGGDIVAALTGPLWYSFGKWRVATLNPEDLVIIPSPLPRMDPPFSDEELDEDELKIVNVNVLNYWTTLDDRTNNARGADSMAEFERQAQKTILAMTLMDADIYTIQEFENNPAAVKDFITRLNAASPMRLYKSVSITGGLDTGADAITCDIIFDENKAMLLGSASLTDDDLVDDSILDRSSSGVIFNGLSRVPIAATFESGTNVVTIATNHFKSKGGPSTDTPDGDQGDGAGRWNLVRTLSAEALVAWLRTYPTGIVTDNIMITGDLNSYANESPITSILDSGFFSFEEFTTDPPHYSYLFDGQFGTLDYMLMSKEMKPLFKSGDIWNVNADEVDAIDYNLDYRRDASIFDGSVPWRFSDHDPSIVILDMGKKGKKGNGKKDQKSPKGGKFDKKGKKDKEPKGKGGKKDQEPKEKGGKKSNEPKGKGKGDRRRELGEHTLSVKGNSHVRG